MKNHLNEQVVIELVFCTVFIHMKYLTAQHIASGYS